MLRGRLRSSQYACRRSRGSGRKNRHVKHILLLAITPRRSSSCSNASTPPQSSVSCWLERAPSPCRSGSTQGRTPATKRWPAAVSESDNLLRSAGCGSGTRSPLLSKVATAREMVALESRNRWASSLTPSPGWAASSSSRLSWSAVTRSRPAARHWHARTTRASRSRAASVLAWASSCCWARGGGLGRTAAPYQETARAGRPARAASVTVSNWRRHSLSASVTRGSQDTVPWHSSPGVLSGRHRRTPRTPTRRWSQSECCAAP